MPSNNNTITNTDTNNKGNLRLSFFFLFFVCLRLPVDLPRMFTRQLITREFAVQSVAEHLNIDVFILRMTRLFVS